MDVQKQVGPISFEVVSGQGGIALKANFSQSVGGGMAAGVLSAKAGFEVDLSAEQAAMLAIDLLEKQFPAMGPFLEATVKPSVKEELEKVLA